MYFNIRFSRCYLIVLNEKVEAIILTQSKKVIHKELGFFGKDRSIDYNDYPINSNYVLNKLSRGYFNSNFVPTENEAIFWEGNPNPIQNEVDISNELNDLELKINWDNQFSGSKKRRINILNWKIIIPIIIIMAIAMGIFVWKYNILDGVLNF